MSLLSQASLVVTPNAFKASKLYSVIPSDGSGDMTSTRATTDTRVNENGLIETVASNVPRIDYTSGQGAILVEPQSTNSVLRSEDTDNVIWIKEFISSSNNNTLSPSGVLNASKIFANSTSNIYTRRLRTPSAAVTSGITYTSSFFVKKAQYNFIHFRYSYGGGDIGLCLNMNTFAVTQGFIDGNNPTSFPPSYFVVNYPNGWVRVVATFTAPSTTNFILFVQPSTSATTTLHTPVLNDGFFFWGAQLEAGSYATSYIPTVASTVTRNADVISKTGISSLIGQTEGAVFVELNFNSSTSKTNVNRIVELTNSINSDRIIIAFSGVNSLITRVTVSGVEQASFTAAGIAVGKLKVALSYSSNGCKFYINGVLRQSNLSATIPITNTINLGFSGATSGNHLNDSINSFQLYKTALTDTECITLTTL